MFSFNASAKYDLCVYNSARISGKEMSNFSPDMLVNYIGLPSKVIFQSSTRTFFKFDPEIFLSVWQIMLEGRLSKWHCKFCTNVEFCLNVSRK